MNQSNVMADESLTPVPHADHTRRLVLEVEASGQGDPLDVETLDPILLVGRSSADGSGEPIRVQVSEEGMIISKEREGGTGVGGNLLRIGQWRRVGAVRVRVRVSDGAEGAEGGAWAEPRILVQSAAGDRKIEQRATLPTDEGRQFVLGRSRGETDMAVDDEHVSRLHVRFFVRRGQQMVEDLQSRWGTLLNGRALTAATRIHHGDELRIGTSVVRYTCYWDVITSGDSDRDRPRSHKTAPAIEGPESDDSPRGRCARRGRPFADRIRGALRQTRGYVARRDRTGTIVRSGLILLVLVLVVVVVGLLILQARP